MQTYTCNVNLNGDRNHVVVKTHTTPAEIMVLQAIHGGDAVHSIQKEPGGRSHTSHAGLREQLDRRYGRTKTGPEADRRPVLVQVFPGWPNRPDFPLDLKAAGIDPLLVKGVEVAPEPEPEPPKPVTQNTYWRAEDEDAATVVYDMTEKGDVLPEGVEVMRKAEWEAAQKDNTLLE